MLPSTLVVSIAGGFDVDEAAEKSMMHRAMGGGTRRDGGAARSRDAADRAAAAA